MSLSVLRKTVFVSLGLSALLAIVGLISLMIGTTDFTWGTLIRGSSTSRDTQTILTIILSYRLPRTLLAAVTGAALAVAGVVFQSVLRNPLADPYVTGIASGGSFGAVVSIVTLGPGGVLGTSLCAFLGSLVTVALVYHLASKKQGSGYVTTVILAGVIVGALMNALTLLIISVAGSHEMQRIFFWLLGDLSLADAGKTGVAGLLVALGWILIFLNASRLNVLMTGDDTAAYLGLDVAHTRVLFMTVAAAITGTAVSVSGPVGFVGLVVPHAMRLLFGPDNRVLLPAALLGGASFLAAADCIARVVAYPVELPVGVITALTGAPFFLYLLLRR
jgi:iron complex transport system permease protein